MNLSANNFLNSIKQKILIFKGFSDKQKISFLTFLGLLILLPIISLATYSAIRYRSKASYPATPPITPPNLTPIPPSFKTVFNEAIYLDNMTSYPSWSWNYVKIPLFKIGESSTFEAWIKLEKDIQGNGSILFKENGFNFAVEGDGKGNNKLFFGSSEFGSANSSSSNTDNMIRKGIWYHVAVVRNGVLKTTKLFLNGKDVTRKDATYYKHGNDYRGAIVIGASFQQAYSQASAGLPATIDEIRISNIARYDSDFRAPFSSPFQRDEDTQLLYHFDANFEEASKDPSKTATPNDDDDVKFVAGYPLTYSKPYSKKPIKWETESAFLSADDFYLVIDGKVYQPNENVIISSEVKNSTQATLEASWQDKGKQIYLKINFDSYENPYGGSWWVSEITTSINDVPENTIYYKDLYTAPVLKQNLNIPLQASPYINVFSNPRPINSFFGKIYFENLQLLPNFSSKPSDQPVVNFKLKFQGINQKRQDQAIDIHLFKNGQKYKSLNGLNAHSDENGIYNVRTLIEPGDYDFYIKGPTHLQKKFENITIKEGENNINLSDSPLLSGNAIDREEEKAYGIVNILDFSILARDYKKFSSPADFDANGIVNIIDFSILATNFNQEGDKLP
jgi:hypothetical protein